MKIEEVIQKSIKKALKKLGHEAEVTLEHPNELSNGDYATNVAMQLAGRAQKKPLEVAEEIAEVLRNDKKLAKSVKEIKAAKPGFINFFLSEDFLLAETKDILKKKDKYGQINIGKGKTALIEYSQMNVAKPIHVGHLRTAILGDSLKRLYKFLGFKAVSDTHYGDWGTQFGMVLYAYKNFGDEKKVKEDPVGELVRLYIDMSNKVEDDPDLREKAKAEFKKLEDGDQENFKLWKWFVDASIKEFEKVYLTLGVLPFDYSLGESFYEDLMKPIVEEALDKNVATKEGEWVYADLENENLGRCILVKSDGATTYHLRDLATYKYRVEEIKVERNLYVVDSRQSHHFRQLFKVIELLGWPGLENTEHVSYGFVTLPEGSLSTRKGRIVQAKEVLDHGLIKSKRVIAEKNPRLKDKEEVALEVTRAAIKFANIIANRNSDIVFDWDKVLKFEGDTGPYLQYTYARIQSVFRKAEDKPKIHGLDLNEEERDLLRHIYKFEEVIKTSFEQNDTHYIAEFLLTLAHRFNSFYGNTPIIKAAGKIADEAQAPSPKERQQRLALSSACADVMKTGLSLLGINVIDEM